MEAARLLVVFAIALSGSQLVGSQTYDYENNGPSTWPTTFPTCNGSRQSPINISPLTAEKRLLPRLVFRGHWTSGVQATLTNDGHSAVVTVPNWATPATLTGGPLKGTYVFANLHFHWGPDPSQGSEHTLGGKSFSMEAHVVHFNQAYGNLSNAASYSDGIAVVGFFLAAQLVTDNPDLMKLVAAVEEVTALSSTTTLPLTSATDWFHSGATTGAYYTYPGSLTTPLCQESVTWIVYPLPNIISDGQVDPFRALLTASGTPLTSNFRPPQPLNGRTVGFAVTIDLFGTLNHIGEGYVRS